jgi:hypothetical protein
MESPSMQSKISGLITAAYSSSENRIFVNQLHYAVISAWTRIPILQASSLPFEPSQTQ